MATFIVIREFRGPIAGNVQSFPEGKVLDDDDYDTALIRASGVRMVAFTQVLLDRILGGDKAPGSALAALLSIGGVVEGTVEGAPFSISGIKTGATQGAAGAAVNELWATDGHATLPDNVVLIGV